MALRVGYLCMESVFSVRPLEALLAAGHDVCFVMRPVGGIETRRKPILKRQRAFDFTWKKALGFPNDDADRNPLAVAAEREIPAWLVGDASAPAAVELVQRMKPDVLVVAFFNQLLKAPVFAPLRLGAVNVHPSMLPRYRGPAPLFWTFRDGCEQTGITVHRLSPGEDDGDVLRAEVVPLPLGTRGEDLIDDLAERAARLVLESVEGLERGTLRGAAQNAGEATRAPRPQDDHMRIDASMGARRIFHFVRGVGRWSPLWTDADGARLRVIDALDLDEGKSLPGETARIGDTLMIGTAEGIVTLFVRPMA